MRAKASILKEHSLKVCLKNSQCLRDLVVRDEPELLAEEPELELGSLLERFFLDLDFLLFLGGEGEGELEDSLRRFRPCFDLSDLSFL